MSKVNLGWIKDKNGEKYAPKTLATEVITKTGKNLEETLINSPQTAKVGQELIVKEVDENGKPIDWEYVDRPCAYLGDEFITLIDREIDFKVAHPQSSYGAYTEIFNLQLKDNRIYNVTYQGVTYSNLIFENFRMGESEENISKYWDYGEGTYKEYPFVIEGTNYNISMYILGNSSRREHVKIEELLDNYIKLDNNYLQDNIPKIKSASVGQLLVVKKVDGNGMPISFGAIDDNFVKKDQYASASAAGLVKTSNTYGVSMSGSNLQVYKASSTDIVSKKHNYRPIVPSTLDIAVKAGLANSKITWSETEKQKARKLIGVSQSDWEQSDSSKFDFIKNRTHYDKVVIYNLAQEVDYGGGIGPGDKNYTPIDERLHELLAKKEVDEILVDGSQITFDNEAYDRYRYKLNNNDSLYLMVSLLNKVAYIFDESALDGKHGTKTISYKYYEQELKQLDEKFIPESIARAKDIITVNDVLNALPTWQGGAY